MVQKGTWVRIKKILLPVGQRAPQDPEDTRNTPLVMWTKGFLAADANLGDEVQVTTAYEYQSGTAYSCRIKRTGTWKNKGKDTCTYASGTAGDCFVRTSVRV